VGSDCMSCLVPAVVPYWGEIFRKADVFKIGLVFEGVVKGVTRALFGRRAPLTPQLKRASARRREEKDGRGAT